MDGKPPQCFFYDTCGREVSSKSILYFRILYFRICMFVFVYLLCFIYDTSGREVRAPTILTFIVIIKPQIVGFSTLYSFLPKREDTKLFWKVYEAPPECVMSKENCLGIQV